MGAYRCLEQARRWKSNSCFFSTSRVYPIGILEQHPWLEQPTRFAWTDVPAAPVSARGVSENCPMTGPALALRPDQIRRRRLD